MPVGANSAIGGGLGGLNVNVGVNLREFNAGMTQVEQRGAQAARSLNSVGQALTTGAGIGAGFAVAGAALSTVSRMAEAAGSAVIGLNSQLEQAKIGFTAFTGSVEKADQFVRQLQQFAASTAFEFPTLLQAARQLTGMGVAAESVIPMLKEVGAVVMGMGGGEVEIKRVNRALTQMIATGKVQADEMNQLAEAGIPAWKMLADSMGLSIGQVRALSKQGQISAQQMLQAFHDFAENNNLDEAMEKMNRSWTVASTNIIDGVRNIAAEGFEPLFNVIRDVAVELGQALTSDAAQQFAADMKATMTDVIGSLRPVQDAISRIWDAFKEQGVSGAFDQLLTEVQNLATEMFGAGVNVVSEYAAGLMEGASSLITEAANFIADTIASYLIGQSPPPVGPLSQIAQGGTALIEAYIDGMRAGASEIGDIAIGIQDAFGKINDTMTLAEGRAALAAAGTDMKALQAASEQVEGAIRTIDDALQQNQSTLRDYQNAAEDIKDAYSAAIEPLQRQVDALKETNDLAQKQADIQTKIQLAQLKGALLNAQGDPVKKAQLENALDQNASAQKALQMQERQLTLNSQAARLAATARGEKYKDTADDQRKNQLAQARLQLEQQEAQIRAQIDGLVDKEAVARIKTQQAQVQSVQAQRDINQEIDSLNRQLQAAPLEAQIKELQQQQQALIKPIQERIEETKREGEALREQRTQWQGLKSDINDVLQAQKAAAAEAKKAQQEAAKAAKDAIADSNVDVGSVFGTQKIDEAATKIGQSFATKMADGIKSALPNLISGAIGGALGGAVFGPLGAIAGAAFGVAFKDRMAEHFGSMEALAGAVAGKISDALNIDTGKANNAAEAFAIIWEDVKKRVSLAVEQIIIDVAKFLDIDVSGGATKFDRIAIIAEEVANRVKTAITDTANTIKEQWQTAVDAVNSAQFQDNLTQVLKNMSDAGSILATEIDKFTVALFGVDFNSFNGGAEGATTKVTDLGTAIKGVMQALVPISQLVVNVADSMSTLGRVLDNLQLLLNKTGLAFHHMVRGIIALLAGDLQTAVGEFNIFNEMREKAREGQTGIVDEVNALIERIKARAAAANAAGKEVGTQTSEGVAAGIDAGAPTVEQASANLATQSVTSIFAQTMQSKSPSQVMVLEGTNITDGLALGITTGTPVVVAAITEQCALMLAEYTTGWSAIHAGTDAQLSEIHALIQAKFTEIAALVPLLMGQMLQDFGTGFSAIHTQMTGQLGEIHALIMMQSESWRAAGLALGTALGEGIAAASLNVQKSMMSLLSAGGAATGSKASPELEGVINKMAQKYGLDPKLFLAQLQHESAGFDPNVLTGKRRGGAGEVGVGQFLPSTLKGLGVDLDTYLKDVNLQVETAAKYLSDLVKQYGDIDKALMAYNGGPGGVGSAATQRYVAIVKQLADTLRQQSSGGGGMQMLSASATRMNMNVDQITAGRQAGLTMEEAQAICGPYAAVLFAQATGKNPSLAEAKELASAVGWTAQRGMGGTGNFMNLLGRMGIQAVRQAATPENINAALAAGNPIALSTPRHYFVGSGGTAQGGINVGATGSVMSRYGGSANMTLAQITEVGGGMNDLIVLTQKLDAQGQQTFNNLTRVTGQFGDAVDTEVQGTQADIQGVADTGTQANTQLAASTQTLAASIQSGVVPAGLAARDAVGQMAIGIQPLISTWANGAMTSNQLAESIVQLASQSGLATAPLEAFKQGNVSIGEALRQVMTQLAQTDPAFAAIQESMSGAQLSTEQLADVLLRGLSNVTGTVAPSLRQMATAVQPIQTAFASGATSSEQFVQSVVELAATSGLTQAPLRQMQDGVISSGQALTQVVEQLAEANPQLQELATNIAAGNVPVEEGAQMFLEWVKAQAEAQTATQENMQVIQEVPTAITDIQAPVADASTTTMNALPEATTVALDSTITAINGAVEPARAAAVEIGNAIVEGIRSTVEAGAESIAEAAKQIVEKALEAAKKAAEEVKKSAGSKGGGDDDKGDEKARGGRLNAGTWTLVGEEGPELISPSGYVYTAGETAGMLAQGVASGLFKLNTFAKGGKTKTTSKKKDKDKGTGSNASTPSGAPQKFEAPKTREELDLEQQILETEQRKNLQLVAMLPLEEAIRKSKRAQEEAARGTLEQQLKQNDMERMIANVDLQIAKLRFENVDGAESMYDMEVNLARLKREQEKAAQGDLRTQLQLSDLEGQRLRTEQQIAQIQVEAAPARAQLAEVERQIAAIQRGSVEDQVRSADLQAKQHENQYQINALNIEYAPLVQEEADLQRDIQRSLEGNVEQRMQIAYNAAQTAKLDADTLVQQIAMLPITKQRSDLEKQIEDATRGTLDQQYAAIDAESEAARLRLQEIDVQGQLRDVEAGTLEMSQEQINALQRQLEVIDNQKAQLQDNSEIQQLQATLNTADARKQVAALEQQERAHQDIIDNIDFERQKTQNQTTQITTQNQVSATGQQLRLTQVQDQLSVFQDQVAELEAQNTVLDLQVQNISLGNTIRADALAAQNIMLGQQVFTYDQQIAQVQSQNDLITAQSTLIQTNNAVAAQGHDAAIIALQNSLDLRDDELTRLEQEKGYLEGQVTLIRTQNDVSSHMHDENLIRLNNQKIVQDNILEDINAQLGSLNAQKKVYEDIRDLANQIANRPANPPTQSSPSGGPPGTVVATATKSGEQTLYLSRGTGTDGWYTASGSLLVQGGNANPPSGYSVRWLAEGGTWRAGEVAVLGEEGAEIAIAKQDMHVFPHEKSEAIARAFGRASTFRRGGGDVEGRNVTVNVEYHRHQGTDYGEGTLPQVVREAVNVALRS